MKNLIVLIAFLFSYCGYAQLKKSTEATVSQNGKNHVVNPGFENYTKGWSNTGGTKAILTGSGDVGEGNRALRFTAAGTGEYIESDLATFSNITKDGVGCMADFYYKSGAGFNVEIYEGTNLVASESIAVDASQWSKFPTITFPCYATMKIRFESTSASTIDVDQVYLGGNKGVGVTTIISDWADFTPTAGAAFGTISNAYGQWRRIGDSVEVIGSFTSGTVTASTGSVNLPSGLVIDSSNTNTQNELASYGEWRRLSGATNFSALHVGPMTYDGSNNYLRLRQASATDTTFASAGVSAFLSSGDSVYFSYKVPIAGWSTTPVVAFTPEQQSFYLNVGIGGGTLTKTLSTSPQVPDQTTMDMVLYNGTARIPCNGSNPSTGLTCSAGTEQAGINFEAPVSGKYRVCASFAGDSSQATIRWVETNNSDETFLQEGTAVVGFNSAGVIVPVRLCDTFDLGIGERTLRIFGEGSGVLQISADRSGAHFNRELNISVELVGHHVSRPIVLAPATISAGAGNAGAVVTSGVSDIDFIEVQDEKGAFDGTTYTVQKSDSIIHIELSIYFSTAVNRSVRLFNNALSHKYISGGNDAQHHDASYMSYRGEFAAGDELTIRYSGPGSTLQNDGQLHFITIKEE